MASIKPFQVKEAIKWLYRWEAQAKGERSYCGPMIYTPKRCVEIIDRVSDKDIIGAGYFAMQRIRELADKWRGKDK